MIRAVLFRSVVRWSILIFPNFIFSMVQETSLNKWWSLRRHQIYYWYVIYEGEGWWCKWMRSSQKPLGIWISFKQKNEPSAGNTSSPPNPSILWLIFCAWAEITDSQAVTIGDLGKDTTQCPSAHAGSFAVPNTAAQQPSSSMSAEVYLCPTSTPLASDPAFSSSFGDVVVTFSLHLRKLGQVNSSW